MPSHARWLAADAPLLRSSPRIGRSRSIGTNMLPGSIGPSLPSALLTTSEPMPTSSPRGLNSAAPLWSVRGGDVNSASSMRYSQYPAKTRRDTMRAALNCADGSPLTTSRLSSGVTPREAPSGAGAMFSGASGCSRPKPVARS